MTSVLALVAGALGMTCLIVGLRRRHTAPFDEIGILLTGGIVLVYAAAASLT